MKKLKIIVLETFLSERGKNLKYQSDCDIFFLARCIKYASWKNKDKNSVLAILLSSVG